MIDCCSLFVGIIFTSYALQVKYSPYLESNMDDVKDAEAIAAKGGTLVYVRAAHPHRGLLNAARARRDCDCVVSPSPCEQ